SRGPGASCGCCRRTARTSTRSRRPSANSRRFCARRRSGPARGCGSTWARRWTGSPPPSAATTSGVAAIRTLHQLGNRSSLLATDLSGRVVWYYDVSQPGLSRAGSQGSLVPGGTMLLVGASDSFGPVLREIDLAGNPLRETSVAAVNAQLTALGHGIIYGFHHDAQRLPNGQTAVIAYTFRAVSVGGTPTDYVGDMIVVLDEDFQVKWAWDAFDHLDVNRGPILGEGAGLPGGPIDVFPDNPRALDGTHSNAVAWSPADGNLVLSVRHQDWVLKIDYENGAGDGHVIWRLGQDGDFTVNSPDPSPWFSHQHNAHYLDD